MKTYFDDSWEVIKAKENNMPVSDIAYPYNDNKHSHLFGVIFTKKLYSRKVYKYHYKINAEQ